LAPTWCFGTWWVSAFSSRDTAAHGSCCVVFITIPNNIPLFIIPLFYCNFIELALIDLLYLHMGRRVQAIKPKEPTYVDRLKITSAKELEISGVDYCRDLCGAFLLFVLYQQCLLVFV
jgi:hypothetical protein